MKLRADVDRSKRKVEGDLKLAQETVADIERQHKDLEQTYQRKDKDIAGMASRLEDEQGVVSKMAKSVKEIQSKIEEYETEVEHERQARAKAEKAKGQMARELADLNERLDEAGGATGAQMELNKKREAELAKLRRDYEEANIHHDSALANLRKKHNDAVAEMTDQIDHLGKMKAKTEKEKELLKYQADEAKSAMDTLARDKATAEKANKTVQGQILDLNMKWDESNRTLNDFDAQKKKLAVENADLLRLLEEGGAKADALRQYSKIHGEAMMWRSKYESEGIARAEEIEAARLKLAVRLEEAELQIENLNVKNMQNSRLKGRIVADIDDMQIQVERAQALANAAEKKQKNFDRVIGDYKVKVDQLAAELDASQKECRQYSTEHFRMKAMYEENFEHLDSVRKENKVLADEIKDLMEQISEGGRSLHEIEKNAK